MHRDLERAGAIESIDAGDAETRLDWIGRTDWSYRSTIAAPEECFAAERIDVVCTGVDTVARVVLNGACFGRVANEFHPHRFDARWSLRPGTNDIGIELESPMASVERTARRLGHRPVNGDWGAYPYLRKAACDFGWDWGPRVRTSGVRGVVIEAWSHARIDAVRPVVRRADPEMAIVDVHVDVERGRDAAGCRVHVRLCGERCDVPLGGVARFEVAHPELWWPRGLGDPRLHLLEVELVHGDVVIDEARREIGLRTIELDTSPDADGTPFRVRVNGRALFCRGANVVPHGALPAAHPRHDDRRAESIVGEAVQAEMNMLRVWGGGRYASDVFYAACDRAGMLVWQDFMLACAAYPEEPPFPQRIAREARYQVARLSAHPSVALWCGGNEVEVAMRCWDDFGTRLAPTTEWGRAYLHELLPDIVGSLDPSRPYWPDSPWSGALDRDPNEAAHGDRHTWDVSFDGYRTVIPRFASEFGHQSPPNRATIAEALGRVPRRFDDPELERRQRALGGFERWYGGPLRAHFRPTDDFETVLWQTQLLQARAMRLACTWLRVHASTCGGALIWQLNDVWTGHSWSLLDVALRRKIAWFAVRDAFAARVVCLHPSRDDRWAAFVVADPGSRWQGEVVARRVNDEGTELARATLPFDVGEQGGSTHLLLPEAITRPGEPSREFVVVDADGLRATQTFLADRDLAFKETAPRVACSSSGGTCRVSVEACSVLRELCLLPDDLGADARVDSGCVTLLPGERHTFVVEGTGAIDESRARAALRVSP